MPTLVTNSKKMDDHPMVHIRTCLIKDAAITLHWAVGRRCAADAGDDSDGTWASKAGAEVDSVQII